jgi:crotonobetainyl-CoA:carnitine CoA-transferase CaiB-like acyl-CoA transferase
MTSKADEISKTDQGPINLFDDLTVVELGQYIAAPYAAELFAHGGADVISIEPVEGAPTRHNSPLGPSGDGRQYVTKARGKRAMTCALSTPEGKAILHDLIGTADVLITNLRPGLADELGIGWDKISQERPSLIYAEIRGFADRGPLAKAPAVDLVAQAASGLLRSIGRRDEGRPVASDVMIADYTAGSLLAFAIAAALRHRERTGLGQRVSTSLMAACLTAQHRRANRFDRVDSWHGELLGRTEPVVGPRPGGDDRPDFDALSAYRDEQIGTAPYFYNCYAVADGEVAVGAVAANGPRLLIAAGLDPADLTGPATLRDLTVGETADLVATHLIDRNANGLVSELRAAGIPAATVRFLEEALADDDNVAAGLLHRFDHARLGPTIMPAPPVTFSAVPYEAANDTPRLGQHTDELLHQLGYDDKTIDRLVADGIVTRATDENTPDSDKEQSPCE